MPFEKVPLGDAVEKGIKKTPILRNAAKKPCKNCNFRKRMMNRTGIKVVIYRSK